MLIEGCMYVYVDLCGFMALSYLESEWAALSVFLFVCVCVCVSLCSYVESFSGEPRTVLHRLLSMSDGQV